MTNLIETRRAEAIAILKANDRGGYTVPTARLYPFQWNWDSAFAAMGFMTFDEPRAWQELDMLFSGQWADGLVPHIIFHQPSDTYFPGPDVWGTNHVPPTSGITQPPVAALAVWQMFRTAKDKAAAERRARVLFPKLLAWHRWWAAARDPDGTGLVAILHNWETGMDNSPAWDEALARVPRTTNPYTRKDTGHVDGSMRPTALDYDRYVHLVETYRACSWQPARMWQAAPFKVAHVGINSILIRAEMDLMALAEALGESAAAAEISARVARMERAMAALWSPALNAFQSVDLTTGARIPAATSAGFLPLLTAVPTPAQAAAMAGEMRRWTALGHYGVPTVAPDDRLFDGKRYWRGPIWCIVNWLLADGLSRHGLHEDTALVRESTARLLLDKGFAEYFDPVDGTPCGGFGFTWTAAAALAFALS